MPSNKRTLIFDLGNDVVVIFCKNKVLAFCATFDVSQLNNEKECATSNVAHSLPISTHNPKWIRIALFFG